MPENANCIQINETAAVAIRGVKEHLLRDHRRARHDARPRGVPHDRAADAHRLRAASESTPPKAVEPAIVNAVSDAASEARSAIATLRTLLIDIYPPNLEEEGLEAAIEGLAVGLRNRDIDTVVDLDPKVELNRSGEALAFRTVQELSRNVQRHSKAQHAWIGIRREGRFTVISVEDDGIGIGDEPVASDHFGTRLLADLADELNGNFEIGPREGGGTVARMEVLSK